MAPSLVREPLIPVSASHDPCIDLVDPETFEPDVLEPVAVIGFSLKFPQDAISTESFWEMLMEGRCAVTDFPKDRMNREAFFHPDSGRPGTLSLRGAHFIQEDLAAFDAPFFSITPAEAAGMDPQQRGLLETAYRALESAGIPSEKVFGSNTSVHAGCFTADYTTLICKDPEQMSKYSATGVAGSMIANRISWFFDLHGPSVMLDTACSSSMVALDLSCQALRDGQSTMGLVAGCNLMYTPDMTIALSNMSFLSHDGRCYSFDHRANGYARGEGFGVVVIKLLSDAIRDGDTIRAVIRSTGSNQDGHTPGVTQPSKDIQARLIRETYQKAGLNRAITRYVEAHGTGTPLGDPIEAMAIGTAFSHQRSQNEPLYIGAVKANIGHLEAASGVAGLIKTILILERGVIPPLTNFGRLNPQIDAEFLNLKFPVQCTPWPVDGLRRASINSFGFGGTNSHAILDDAYNYLRLRHLAGNHCTVKMPPPLERLNEHPKPKSHSSPNSGLSHQMPSNYTAVTMPKLLVWSAADEGGLKRLAAAYSQHFLGLSNNEVEPGNYLDDLAFTLEKRRSSLPWKSFVIADSIIRLHSLDIELSPPVRSAIKPQLGFVFTGQGAQWHAMGRELLAYPVFKHSLLNVEEHLCQLHCQWSLLGELLKEKADSRINEPSFSQPICTAIQIALIDLLRSFGITPSAVVGHSSGEIAAAYCAGALSCGSALRIAYYRGALADTLAKSSRPQGAMISVALSETEVLPYLEKITLQFGERGLTVACINSPKNVTVSGDESQVDVLKSELSKDHIFARKLHVTVAYHSPQMTAIASEYLMLIQDLEEENSAAQNITMVSSVTGQRVSAAELCRGEYWVQNMISPVNFSKALGRICSHSSKDFRKKLDGSHRDVIMTNDLVEVGPHSALQGPIRDILKTISRGKEVTYSSVLIRNRCAIETILEVAGRLHCFGYPVHLAQMNRPSLKASKHPLVLTNLPEYPFDHTKTYWHETRLSKGFRFRRHPHIDLLGSPTSDWNPLEARWRNVIKLSESPWVEDHMINGSLLYPAAGMLVMGIEAVSQVAENRRILGYEIKDVTFSTPVNISPNSEGLETQLYLRPLRDASDKDNAWSEFRLCVYDDVDWAEACRGTIRVDYEGSQTEVDGGKAATEELRNLRQVHADAARSCTNVVEPTQFYERLQACGYQYGLSFQSLEQLHFNDEGEAMAEVKLFQWALDERAKLAQPRVIHPATLDGVLQLMFTALAKGGNNTIPTMVPTRVNRLWISSSGFISPDADSVRAYAKVEQKGHRTTNASISVLSRPDENLRIQIEGLETTAVASAEAPSQSQFQARQLCYYMDWKPDIEVLANQQVLQYCKTACAAAKDPIEFFEELTFLLFVLIFKTMKEVTSQGINPSLGYLRNYVSWMQRQLDMFDGGELLHSRPDWTILLRDLEFQGILWDRVGKTNKQGELYLKVGQNLTGILSGQVDPLDLLFENDLVKDFYEDVNESANCFHEIRKYLDALAHKNPGMNILEVGAGTGATTKIILDVLIQYGERESTTPRYARYDFTDISFSFFEKAREMFQNYQRMNFTALDIEDDPTRQGFEAQAYDLIVAANVLHATKNLSATIQNIRKLLKPGGKLLLVEVTRPDLLRVGFIFGLLPGWWLSTEEYRSQSPCISEQKWHDVLMQNGFSGTDLVFQDYEGEANHGFSIMVSTALGSDLAPLSIPRTLIIAEEGSALQTHLAQQVQTRLEIMGGRDCNVVSLKEAALNTNLHETYCILLSEIERQLLQDPDPQSYQNIRSVLISTCGILWVTKGGGSCPATPGYGTVQGLSRVFRTENPQSTFVTLALESVENNISGHHVQSIMQVFRYTILRSTRNWYEPEYVEIDGMPHINRVISADDLNREVMVRTADQQSRTQKFGEAPPLKLAIGTSGLLDTLYFQEDVSWTRPLAADDVEIEVKAIGVNFLDCLVALGRVDANAFGSECAGIVRRAGKDCCLEPGDRVSVSNLDTYRTYARSTEQCVLKIPDEMSFVEAAAVPTTFVTVYHGLCEVARIQRGESILINAAAGGTGQAAIQVAKLFGAEVYATVGSEQKKQLIMSLYGIPEDHILYSRDVSFARGIKAMTRNRGVDIVFNSLAGGGLVASWECIAPYGRFIEIGKRDIHSHSKLPMFPFAKNVSFSAIDVATMPKERPALLRKSFESAMALIVKKQVHIASPLHVYKVSEIEQAFRFLQSGKNSGKIVVEVNLDDLVQTVLDTKPTYQLDDNATYVISGGLGGLGRSIARWMVSRGSRHLLLLSRSGPRSSAAELLLKELRDKGVQVETPACDVTNASSLDNVLREHERTMPPVKGCILGTMVLRDAIFEKMSVEDWNACVAPKIQGSWNLHRRLPKAMDFFILLSSVSGITGAGGQANYAAGNTYQDALARHRVGRGQKAVSIDLGLMLSEGFLAENDDIMQRLSSTGHLPPISLPELFALLDYYCNPTLGLLTPIKSQLVTGVEISANLLANGGEDPEWMRQPLFRHLHQMEGTVAASKSAADQAFNVAALFKAASSLAEAGSIVAQALVKKLSKILLIPQETIDLCKPMHLYGVDSLIAVELRNWFAKELNADVAIFEILGGATSSAVGVLVAEKSRYRQDSWME